MAQVYNKRHGNAPADAVYVGRPTRWGNPFVVGRDGERGECAELYRNYLWTSPELLEALPELFDRDLICWCKPRACHADHLLEAAAWAKAHPFELGQRIHDLVRDHGETCGCDDCTTNLLAQAAYHDANA